MSIFEFAPPVTSADQRVERFRSVYDSSYPDIEAYCRRRLGSDRAADAVSETFLTAWRRFDDVPADRSARLWLFGVARRVVANQLRTTSRQDKLHLRLVEQPTTQQPGADVMADSMLEQSPFVQALAMLSPDDAEVLRLVAWEELSHADAGVVLDCSANAVGVRMHRARQRLADALAQIPNQIDQTSHLTNEQNHD